jgi:membrane protein DedA with SNARE-associated domain
MTPETLDEVPRNQQIRQTFGWHPALVGLVLLGSAALFANSPAPNFQTTIGILAGLVGLGFLLLFYEWYRRRKRVVLCRFEEGLAVYGKGKHDVTVQPHEITVYALNWGNTFQYLLIPGVLIVGLAGAFLKVGPLPGVLLLALVVALSTSSLVYTRLVCKHRLVRRKSRGRQQVIFRRADVAKLSS